MKKSIATLAAIGALGLGLSVASPVSAHGDDHETEHETDHETTPPPSQTLAEILLSDSAGDDANGFDKNSKDWVLHCGDGIGAVPALIRAADLNERSSDRGGRLARPRTSS